MLYSDGAPWWVGPIDLVTLMSAEGYLFFNLYFLSCYGIGVQYISVSINQYHSFDLMFVNNTSMNDLLLSDIGLVQRAFQLGTWCIWY